MALRIEDYAMIGDTELGALVGKNGSIDWLCAPRFDSPAFFAALLGTQANSHWQIVPAGETRRVERRYRQGTLVLETDFEMEGGVVRLVDCMPLHQGHRSLVRVIEGVRGRVAMQMRLASRFDYGRLIPSLGRIDQGVFALAGPDAVCLRAPVDPRVDKAAAAAAFEVSAGDRVPFHLVSYLSHLPRPEPIDPFAMVEHTEVWWREWSGRCQYRRSAAGRSGSIADYPESAYPFPHGCDRGSTHHVAAGRDRRGTQLGLPLLLVARRLLLARSAPPNGLHRRGGGLAGLAVACHRR